MVYLSFLHLFYWLYYFTPVICTCFTNKKHTMNTLNESLINEIEKDINIYWSVRLTIDNNGIRIVSLDEEIAILEEMKDDRMLKHCIANFNAMKKLETLYNNKNILWKIINL